MAWETRNGRGRYYTRSRKVEGEVAREYVGCGRKGELAAQADEWARAERQAVAALLARQEQDWRAADAGLEQLGRLSDVLSHAALYAAGFRRQNRGKWRRRRERDERDRAAR